jgi:Tol biopolymer transport system component
MNVPSWDRVKQVFQAALKARPDERSAYVQNVCAGDRALQAEVESMLAAHERAGSFAEGPAAGTIRVLERTLRPGTRIGAYRIDAWLGEGGMGEVYRARDTTLGRDVAIKILPALFAVDESRLARFEREARVLAALNHPRIAAIHGVENADGVHALVLELVEGPTLADRLRYGPLAIEEVLSIAKQIAEALEAAHEKGIVHRDLKPANIKVTREAGVKLLDFGLAKAAAPDAPEPSAIDISGSHDGLLLGTAPYMSPEQARGKPVDTRSDIWAFGCVLYEMLTGRPAFGRETVSDTIAAILEREPDFGALPSATPAPVALLVRRCLKRDLSERLHDISDARLAIDDAADARGSRRAFRTTLACGAVAAMLAGAFLLGMRASGSVGTSAPGAPGDRSVRFTVGPPAGMALDGTLALSPDGRSLVFAVQETADKYKLWIRRLDVPEATPLAGTDDGQEPFWSPDSRHVGFFAEGKLKKIDIAGGPPVTICAAKDPRGGAWNRAGVIVFAPDGRSALLQVSSMGGVPTPATRLDPGVQAGSHRWPHFLPDDRHFLYLAWNGNVDRQGIFAGSLDSFESDRVLKDSSSVAFVAPGYLLFARENALLAQPFDLRHVRVTGDFQSIVENVGTHVSAYAPFSVSDTGSLAYQTYNPQSRLVWFDRHGAEVGSLGDVARQSDVAISPDGTQVLLSRAVERGDVGEVDIWLFDRIAGTSQRLTASPSVDVVAVWSPDRQEFVFRSSRNGPGDIYRKPIGPGQERLLLKDSARKDPTDWSSDGRFLLYNRYDSGDPQRTVRVWVLPVGGGSEPMPLQRDDVSSWGARFSPDVRAVAFVSDKSGRDEVYVGRFPAEGDAHLVSSNGGREPAWRRDGRELFYLAEDGTLMSVEVSPRAGGSMFGKPTALFRTRSKSASLRNTYDVSPDGQTFLVNQALEDDARIPITVELNWTTRLRR